jgi:multidrug resistance efflux pump
MSMSLARAGFGLAGVIAALAATLAMATLWLLLTDPVTVADAVAQGDMAPLVSMLAGALATALRGLLSYL